MITRASLLKLFKKLEWSSFQQGQGSGFMSSGGDGPWVSSCPYCDQIKPGTRGASDFMESAHGHKRSCRLNLTIIELGKHKRQNGGV